MGLIVDLRKEIAVITGCGHSGIINIAEHAIALTGKPIKALVGGFHLRGDKLELLEQTADKLDSLGVKKLYAGHCTGIDEYAYRKTSFRSVEPLFVEKAIKV